jgi:hypothetical protein
MYRGEGEGERGFPLLLHTRQTWACRSTPHRARSCPAGMGRTRHSCSGQARTLRRRRLPPLHRCRLMAAKGQVSHRQWNGMGNGAYSGCRKHTGDAVGEVPPEDRRGDGRERESLGGLPRLPPPPRRQRTRLPPCKHEHVRMQARVHWWLRLQAPLDMAMIVYCMCPLVAPPWHTPVLSMSVCRQSASMTAQACSGSPTSLVSSPSTSSASS